MEVDGWRPSLTLPYNASLTSLQRIEQLVQWIERPDGRPSLLAAYLADVDTAGHWWGPESRQVDEALVLVDAAIQHLIVRLQEKGLLEECTIVVVGDHGMSALPTENLIAVEDVFGKGLLSAIGWMDLGPVSSLIPADPDACPATLCGQINRALRVARVSCRCYPRSELPHRYRYDRSPRIAPLTIDCESGHSLTRRNSSWRPRGQHGYDPDSPLMATIFAAVGQRIPKGLVLSLQNNLDVYNLLAELLGISPKSNDGSGALRDEILQP